MIESTPSSNRLLSMLAWSVRWLSWFMIAALMVFAVAWGVLHGFIVPRIGEFRPRVEAEASRALGVPVRIGELTAQSTGLVPSFELRDVQLLDPQGREALRLPRVLAALSPKSLWNLGFDQLTLEQPVLDVRRAANGRVFVAGLDLTNANGGDSRAADWFLSQTEFVIRGGAVRWTDELRDAPALSLSGVNLVLRNTARRHQFRLDATPPADWGDRFELLGQFRRPLLARHPGRLSDWTGQLHAHLPRVDVAQLRRHVDPGVEVHQGNGAVRVWTDVIDGRFTGAVADLALQDVAVTLETGLPPLALDTLSGRLGLRQLAGGFEVFTESLQFTTPDGLRWPGGNARLTYTGGEGRVPAQGELTADRLDLAALAQVANRLPLGTATHAALTAHAPRGLVETLKVKWQGHPGAVQRYEARGRATGLALAGLPGAALPAGSTATHPPLGVPGVQGAAVDFDFTQAGGKATLEVTDGALEFQGLMEEPVIPMDRLTANLQWQVRGTQIGVQVNDLKFTNADAQGEAKATWKTGDPQASPAQGRYPGVLELEGTARRADGSRVHRYLPLVIPAATRHYVRDAVTGGQASNVKFAVRGDLTNMPFLDPRQGAFRISAQMDNVTYAYVPANLQAPGELPWPALRQLAGELVIDRGSLRINGANARLQDLPGLAITRAEAHIANLGHSPTVVVTADARGPVSDMVAMTNASPLRPVTGPALGRATVTGNADLRLRLTLPLLALDTSRVQGSVTLAGNDVLMAPGTPLLGRAQGLVTFSEKGFAITGGQARVFGGETRLDGGTRVSPSGETVTALRAQGSVTADGLRQARELGLVSRLAQNAAGAAPYTANLTLRQGAVDVTVSSTLEGMALNLPAPLGKPAESALPLRFENSRVPTAASGAQDQVLVDLGRELTVAYVRDVSGAEPRVLRGGIGVGMAPGESAPFPDAGVMANINLASLDVDAWERVLSGAAGAPVALPAESTVAAAAGGASRPLNPVMGYLPTTLAVRAREITVEGRKLTHVVAGGSRDGLVWRANIDATELNGYVEYRQPAGAGAGRVLARLARLSITQGNAAEVESLLDGQPVNVPALDIVVDDFELRGKKLGRVEVDAINRGATAVAREGGVREWRLNKLNVTMPEASFAATGNWAAVDAQALPAGAPRLPRPVAERRRTVMNFKLDIADSGALLTRFGMKDVVRQGKGVMAGQVAWVGSPLALDYPSLTGQFNINIDSGQFLKADPGLAKLLGVLSLQSLPRRLTLDFRDVFSDGFAFDFVRGDVRIGQGIASTNNLQMKGVNAAVLMEGGADIARETQDLKVVVVPEINAGTASLVAAAINPAIGLGTFLAQMFLRRPLTEAATQEFHVDGTWADPKVTRVVRGMPAPDPGDGTAPRSEARTDAPAVAKP